MVDPREMIERQTPPGNPHATIDPSKVVKMEALDLGDRMTVKIQLYHEHSGEQPHATDVSFSGTLDTEHEVYQRRLNVGNDWEPLDIGWIPEGDVGYVVLDNRTGKGRHSNPTEAEKAEEALHIVYVRLGDDGGCGWPVRPGRFFIAAAGSDTIQVRAEGEGHTRLNVEIYPR